MPGRLYPRVGKVGAEACLKDFAVAAAFPVQAGAYMGVFPLAFTSSVSVPVQTMPG